MFEGYKQESGTEARVPQGLTEPEEVTTANIWVTEMWKKKQKKLSVIFPVSLNNTERDFFALVSMKIKEVLPRLQAGGAEAMFCLETLCGWVVMLSRTPGGDPSANETAGQPIGSSLRGWRAGWQPIWSVMCQRGEGGGRESVCVCVCVCEM